MRYWAGALGAMIGFGIQVGVPGCSKDECVSVACDYTHVTVSIVTDGLDDDGNPEAGTASRVVYTVLPYNEDGDLMSEDELEESGFNPEQLREASCANRNEDEGTCDTWVAGAGFGQYEITAFLCDEEDESYQPPCNIDNPLLLDRSSGTADLTVPADEKATACCGKVSADAIDITLFDQT